MEHDIPRTCAEWQAELTNIANGCEPMDPYVGTMARMHALRCPACWNAFEIASAEAARRGIRPVPPMPQRVVADMKPPARTEPVDLNVN